jgi:hypothetical protein
MPVGFGFELFITGNQMTQVRMGLLIGDQVRSPIPRKFRHSLVKDVPLAHILFVQLFTLPVRRLIFATQSPAA